MSDFILSFKFMCKRLLVHFQTGKGLFYIGITNFISVFVLKYDMFPLFFPLYRPSSLCHAEYEFLSTGRLRDHFQQCYGAVGNEALLGIIYEQVVFILAPCGDLTLFYQGAVEMMSFLSYRKSSLTAEIIGKFLLTFEIMLGLMEFLTVNV